MRKGDLALKKEEVVLRKGDLVLKEEVVLRRGDLVLRSPEKDLPPE